MLSGFRFATLYPCSTAAPTQSRLPTSTMPTMTATFNRVYEAMLSDNTRRRVERGILAIAIVSFVVHLLLILGAEFGLFGLNPASALLRSPIAAVYTPFSFILIYEVYLLIYFLPKSISTYIAKQYEIITLILIRRLFKDFANLSLSTDWFKIKYDLNFTYDLLASLLLFYLIYQFHRRIEPSELRSVRQEKEKEKYIRIKRWIASLLVPILFLLATYSFFAWLRGFQAGTGKPDLSFQNINNVFFEHFFSVLIITDVLLLLFSLYYTDAFHKIMRNSGFIISTILLRLSFSVGGLLNVLLLLAAVVFGLLMLVLHNAFEKRMGANHMGGE